MVKDGIAWQQIDNIMLISHVCQSAGLFAWSCQIMKRNAQFCRLWIKILACGQARVFFFSISEDH